MKEFNTTFLRFEPYAVIAGAYVVAVALASFGWEANSRRRVTADNRNSLNVEIKTIKESGERFPETSLANFRVVAQNRNVVRRHGHKSKEEG